MGGLHPQVLIIPIFFDSVGDCGGLALKLLSSQPPFAAVFATVHGLCRQRLLEDLNGTTLPVLLLGQGFATESDPTSNAFTVLAPRFDIVHSLAVVLLRLGWTRGVLLTIQDFTSSELDELQPLKLKAIVKSPQLRTTNCTNNSGFLSAVKAVKNARTPLIILDMYVRNQKKSKMFLSGTAYAECKNGAFFFFFFGFLKTSLPIASFLRFHMLISFRSFSPEFFTPFPLFLPDHPPCLSALWSSLITWTSCAALIFMCCRFRRHEDYRFCRSLCAANWTLAWLSTPWRAQCPAAAM